MEVTLNWAHEDDTRAWAERLALQPALANAFITLQGELGAGKTTFTRYLLRALGVPGRVKSPSFSLVELYGGAGGLQIAHCDFYRFRDASEWEDAGLRDLFAASGLKIAEWPDRAKSVLPQPDLVLQLTVKVDGRREVVVQAPTERGAQMLRALQT